MQLRLFSTSCDGDTLIIAANEDIGSLDSANVRDEADRLLAERSERGLAHIAIDLAMAQYFGSQMLHLFLILWRQVSAIHGTLVLYNVSEAGRSILHVTSLEKLWPICATREEALARGRAGTQEKT